MDRYVRDGSSFFSSNFCARYKIMDNWFLSFTFFRNAATARRLFVVLTSLHARFSCSENTGSPITHMFRISRKMSMKNKSNILYVNIFLRIRFYLCTVGQVRAWSCKLMKKFIKWNFYIYIYIVLNTNNDAIMLIMCPVTTDIDNCLTSPRHIFH